MFTVSGQLLAPSAALPGKEPLMSIEQKAVWAVRDGLDIVREEK